MTKINVLDKSVFNRIAAGEVVERPASIVKELVENSIDAGAAHIKIAIEGGGIKSIYVSDDGKGISPDSVKTAFLPHATSKIAKVEDLDSISTLGFRGEALPSIASVATVTMVTRESGAEMGTRYVLDNGVETDFGEIGAPCGTSVCVENLFARIPARRKFLQKESVEENAVTSSVAKFILANPNISFEYTSNGKIIYFSDGEGVESAIKTIYGGEYLTNTLYVHSNISDIVLCGYINKPAYTKHSRQFQTLIVNGRYVQCEEISYTVFGCYQKYLMKRQYPTYVLYLNLPCDLVDVNVHPSKTEVRFAVIGIIKKLIADTIKDQVLSEVAIPKDISEPRRDEEIFDFFKAQRENPQQESGVTSTDRDVFSDVFSLSDKSLNKNETNIAYNKDIPIDNDKKSVSDKRIDSSVLDLPPIDSFSDIVDPKPSTFRENSSEFERKDTLAKVIDSIGSGDSSNGFGEVGKAHVEQSEVSIESVAKLIGKLFNTYLVIEQGNFIYLIDQHAAHEKILFDNLMKQFNSSTVAVQKMLVPYEFKVSPVEVDVLVENLDKLKNAGFIIKQKGLDKFELSAVPASCSAVNVQSFVADFLSEIKANIVSHDLLASIMQSACKAAVKGEDDLSESEVSSLLHEISQNVSELFCPHGRPISVRLSRSEIEKWFKRLV